MADITYSGTLVGSDGSSMALTNAVFTVTAGDAVTTPATPVKDAPKTVRIGVASYPLTAVNPTTTEYPGGRGPDQLVIYQAPLTATATNQYGAEVEVLGGACGVVNDRQLAKSAGGTAIHPNGYVLSGHGKARDFLLANARVGAGVDLSNAATPTTPRAAAANLSTWWMIWSNSSRVRAIDLPDEFDELRIAFAQGTPIALVGDSPGGLAQMQADLKALQAKGKRVTLSIGGGGGDARTSDTQGFLDAFKRIEDKLGIQFGGLNYDIESSTFNGTECLRIAERLRADRGDGLRFRLSWSPNGSNKGPYLAAAKAGLAGGLVDEFGQQFYDSPVSLGAARGEIEKWLAAKLTPEQLCVGMMVGNSSNYWTVDTCAANMASIRSGYGIRSAYLWELGRTGTKEWGTRIRAAVN